MKDMTEKEARAVLKKAMPWAKDSCFDVCEGYLGGFYASVDMRAGGASIFVEGEAKTIREAVRRCIAAARKVGAAK